MNRTPDGFSTESTEEMNFMRVTAFNQIKISLIMDIASDSTKNEDMVRAYIASLKCSSKKSYTKYTDEEWAEIRNCLKNAIINCRKYIDNFYVLKLSRKINSFNKNLQELLSIVKKHVDAYQYKDEDSKEFELKLNEISSSVATVLYLNAERPIDEFCTKLSKIKEVPLITEIASVIKILFPSIDVNCVFFKYMENLLKNADVINLYNNICEDSLTYIYLKRQPFVYSKSVFFMSAQYVNVSVKSERQKHNMEHDISDLIHI